MAASNAAPSPTPSTTTIVWFRRDLRLDDNHALIAASLCGAVVPVFVWSPEEEGQFYPGRVARWWLKQSLAHLRAAMQDLGATLVIRRSRSTLAVLLEIIAATGASQLFYNHLYDPVSLVRDHRVKEALSKRGIAVRSFNADLLFEPWEIRCGDRVGIISPSVPGGSGGGGGAGGPANSTASGPAVSCVGGNGGQMRKSGGGKGCRSSAAVAVAVDADSYTSTVTFEKFLAQCLKRVPEAPLSAPKSLVMPSVRRGSTALQSCHISDLQLESPDEMSSNSLLSRAWLPGCTNADRALLAFLHGALLDYAANRGKADSATTSLLSPHLHFGEISVRRILHSVRTLEQAWVSEGLPNASASAAEFFRSLCFREYSRFLTFNFPFTHERSLLCHLKFFPWNVDEGLFKAWRQGRTGYPLVDAAMRELWATGWMHNRLRVVTASFCVKYLQLPWRWGMKYFWDALLDADLECDVLGWQYVSGSLPDGHELDRMDDPEEWGWRIDPEGEYIRRWLPELSRLPTEWLHRPWEAPPQLLRAAGVELGYTYPRPVVDVCTARKQLEHALDTMWQREASRRAALANGVEEGGGEHAPPVQEATSRLSKHSAAAAMEARDSAVAAGGGPLPSGAAAIPAAVAVAGGAAGGIAAGVASLPIVACGLDQMVPSLEAVEAADAILNPAQRISKLAAAGAGADDLEAIQPELPQEISLVNHVGQGRSDGGAAEQVVDGASGVEVATGPVELQLFPCLASGKATEEAGSAVQQQPGEAAPSMHRQVPVAGLLKQSVTPSVTGDGQSNAMKLARETGWRVCGGTGGTGRRVDASVTRSLDLAASAAQARNPSPADNPRDSRVTPTTATHRQHMAVPSLPSLGASAPAASSTPNAAGLGSAGGAATFSAVMGGLWRVPGGGQAGMGSAAQPAPLASPLQPLESTPSSATPSAKKSEEKAALMMAKNPKRSRANLDLLEPAVVPAPRRRSVNPK